MRGISRYGRASQGVRVMNIRGDDDQVSAVALVVESDSPEVADIEGVDGEAPEGAEPAGEPLAQDAPGGVIAIGEDGLADEADLGVEGLEDHDLDDEPEDEPDDEPEDADADD